MNPLALGDALARLNAGLNSASFLLLVLGWLSIRAGHRERHRVLMQLAFATSTLFLVSYLVRYALTGTHHLNATGGVKAFYLALLFSHMILAAATVPLVLRALFLAYKKRFAEHRKIARITAPIWTYVSLTGVLVYVLLYHVIGTVEAAVPAAEIRLPLPAFTLTDQRGQPFGRDRLAGKVWIADFVFTTCPTVCPKLTARMGEIQEKTKARGDRIHLLTFTVDPENDTPAILANYAKANHADEARWTFLTGSLGAIEGAVMNGFKIAFGKREDKPGTGIMTIFHGEKFVLVDREGNIRGYYDADEPGTKALLAAADALAR
jgi:protein SCO1/2